MDDAAAQFTTLAWTVGVQDDWEVNESLQLTGGVRIDLYGNPDRPAPNPNFLARYGFSNRETFSGRYAIQPRVGFNWQAMERLIIRGGVGIFAGGTPDVFLSNSFSNTGLLTNQIDINRAGCAASGTCAAFDGVTGRGFPGSVTGFLATNTASLAVAPVNAIDPDLDVASQLRATLSASYEADLGGLGDGWLFGVDFLYGNVLDAYQWTDIRSVVIGALPDGRPRYGPLGGVATSNQDLLMTNSSRGRSYIGVIRLAKSWDWGLSIDASYTRSDVTDTNAITSATAGSLYSNNAFLDPNQAAYGRSIYEISNQWKFRVDYNHAFFGDYRTRFSLFGEYRSGRPYSITSFDPTSGRLAVTGTIGNAARHLLYIPEIGDSRVVFGANVVGGVTLQTAAQAETLFNSLVTDLGLEQYRGGIVPKNTQTSPDFFKVDLHLSQEIPTFIGSSRIQVFADIENFLNLIDSDWGSLRQVAFPQTHALVNIQCINGAGVANTTSSGTCAQYRYFNVTAPNETLIGRQSLYQIRLGIRFEF